MELDASTTALIQVVVSFGLGLAAKYIHGNVFGKIHNFRVIVDQLDDIIQTKNATADQVNNMVSNARAIITRAQTL